MAANIPQKQATTTPKTTKTPKKHPTKIQHIMMMGDSLSDRGTMANRELLGILPMDVLSGLRGKSPNGRFSNGFVWSDHLAAKISEEFYIQHQERIQKKAGCALETSTHTEEPSESAEDKAEDIADDVIAHDKKDLAFQAEFNLDDDGNILYCGSDFIRTYCEGGLSAADYSGDLYPPKMIPTRNIVSHLQEKTDQLLQDDMARHKDAEYKDESLIVEWSGANDFITVNEEPTLQIVRNAVSARIKNIRQLYASGYKNFVLVNMPDLTLTPRYQNARTQNQRDNMTTCVKEFNRTLEACCEQLRRELPELELTVIDVNSEFNNLYNHPENFNLDPKLKKSPYLTSPDFKINKDQTSPAPGYLFWDDVHPTSNVHAILAEFCYKKLKNQFKFVTTHESLTAKFVDAYAEKLKKDRNGCFGFFRRSRFGNYKTATLEQIFTHALKEKGNRTFDVLVELGWLTRDGNPGETMNKTLALKQAYHEVTGRTSLRSLNTHFDEPYEVHDNCKSCPF